MSRKAHTSSVKLPPWYSVSHICAELHVFQAEVYMEGLPFAEGLPYAEACAEEVHNFQIHKEGGGRLVTQEEEQYALDCSGLSANLSGLLSR